MRSLVVTALIFLMLPLFSTEIQLIPEAQLRNRGNEYFFSFPITMTILDDELFVMDQPTGKIHVFDKQSLAYKRSFGSIGSEPGQFDKPMDIVSDVQGNLVISDYGNDRFQIITPYGEFIEEIAQIYPWRINLFEDELYVDLFPGIPKAGIYLLDGGQLYQEVELDRYFRKENFNSVLQKYYSWCVTDWGFVLSFSGIDDVVIFNRKGRKKRTKVDSLPFTLPNTLYGKPNPYDDGFLLLGSANDHVAADSTDTEVNYEGYLGYYDQGGNLLSIYKLPKNMWLTDTWTIEGDIIYLYDSGNFIINRFRLD